MVEDTQRLHCNKSARFKTFQTFRLLYESVTSKVTGRFDAIPAKQSGYDREERCDRRKMTRRFGERETVTNCYGKLYARNGGVIKEGVQGCA